MNRVFQTTLRRGSRMYSTARPARTFLRAAWGVPVGITVAALWLAPLSNEADSEKVKADQLAAKTTKPTKQHEEPKKESGTVASKHVEQKAEKEAGDAKFEGKGGKTDSEQKENSPQSEGSEKKEDNKDSEKKEDSENNKDSDKQEGEAEGEEQGQAAAFNPETGEINWDCPCLGGMAHGPCGEEFKAAFACFVYSETEPKGIDCISKFEGMRTCFKQHPEHYKEELYDDDEPVPSSDEAGPETVAESSGPVATEDISKVA